MPRSMLPPASQPTDPAGDGEHPPAEPGRPGADDTPTQTPAEAADAAELARLNTWWERRDKGRSKNGYRL